MCSQFILCRFEKQRVGENEIMPKVDPIETSNNTTFVNKKLVLDDGVKILTIKSVPDYKIVEYKDKETGEVTKTKKMCCICTTNVLDPAEVEWQMNQTTSNYLIKDNPEFGSVTEKWVGKEIEIAIKQVGNAKPGIYPKNCSLEKVIA